MGSTKTTAAIIKCAYEAKRVAPCADGIRRSRTVIVRNTNEQLADTTIPDFLKWFGDAGEYAKTGKRFLMQFDDVESEILFRGLDDANDVKRLLSLQLSFGFLDEFREIHPDVFHALTGRLGRYPDKTMNGVGCCDDDGKQIHKVWGATNAPDMDTFWHEYLTEPPSNAHITIQPGGRSAEADWLHCLPDDYYENLAEGKSEAWISVYIDGKFGESLSGKPVFRSFNRDIHVAKNPLVPNRMSSNPIIVGFDCTGLNPAAVIGQMGFEGRLQIYDELVSVDMGAIRFIREKLKPLLVNKYAGMSVLNVIDPAGVARGADEKNVVDMMKAEGLRVIPAKTNGIAARIAAVEQFLTRLVDGKSGIVVDPVCTTLIQGLAGKYRYRVNTKGEVDDKPEKTHPHADIMDSAQYLCLHADGGALFGSSIGVQKKQIVRARYHYA